MIGIYKITSPTNRVYIGQSVNIKKRFKQYLRLDNCNEQPKLYNSLKKYGCDKHVYEIIENCQLNKLNVKERYWQDFYNAIGEYGLNCRLTKVNDRSGYFCEETKQKMSDNHGRYFKGKKFTDEHKKNLSLALTGRKQSEFTRKKISDTRMLRSIKSHLPMLGKKHTKKTKDKITKSLLGNNYNGNNILDLNTGVFYNSIKDCADVYGYKADTFRWRLNKGHHKELKILN